MTFEQYVAYAGTPENLAREAGWWLGRQRHDFSGLLRDWYTRARLDEPQVAAIRWLAAQPGGPANVLVISEEWSSDCRRDVPVLARLAEAGDLDLRIFPRDGEKLGRGPKADPAESPNADIVNEFLNEKDGQTFQSVPVAVFFTKDFEPLYRYIEFPAVYHKMRIAEAMQAARPGGEPRAGLGSLHPRLARAPGRVAVLPDMGERCRRRDALGAPRAPGGRADILTAHRRWRRMAR